MTSVLSTVKSRDFAFKIDLEDTYFHIPSHLDSQKYLHFAFQGKVYQFKVLPLGLNTVPQVFTCLGHNVAAYLHHSGNLCEPQSQ